MLQSRQASVNRAKEVEALHEAMEAGAKSDKETLKIGKQLKKAEDVAAKTGMLPRQLQSNSRS